MKKIKYAMAVAAVSLSTLPATAVSDSMLQNLGSVNPGPVNFDGDSLAIIGGQDAQAGAWPSTVALVRNNNQSLFLRQFCGANQISDRWAVTAAHCMYDAFGLPIDPSLVKVAVGFDDLANESDATELVVTNIILHPQYNVNDPSSPHDLALIEYANESPQPSMPLYNGDANNAEGENSIVVGWGSNDFSNPNQPLFPSMLNQVSVPLVSREVCNLPESYDGLITDGQICAGLPQGGRDSCVGDSGGPLMVLQGGEFRQVGVVSYGRGCAEPGFYGVYTRLAYYADWINEMTSANVNDNGDDTDGMGGGNNPIVPSSSDGKVSGGGSLGPFLPLFMMLLSALALRRHLLNVSESERAND